MQPLRGIRACKSTTENINFSVFLSSCGKSQFEDNANYD